MLWCATVHCFPQRQVRQTAGQFGAGAAQSGKPNPGVTAIGSGNNINNFGISGQAGIGIPVYNGGNNKPSVGVGATIGGSFGVSNGQSFGSKPNYGVGVGVSFPFGRK
ncbi:unnamed protein product [Adineta steineri]|nr:unnamed protein product [Adineta steineri]CAF4001057.1 unnamed protein product [Adineta steineri]